MSDYSAIYHDAGTADPDPDRLPADHEERIDAVVAAVRKDMRSAFREEIQTLKPSEWRQEGRQAAARDIRADGADGCAEYYARIAEGGQEVAPPE